MLAWLLPLYMFCDGYWCSARDLNVLMPCVLYICPTVRVNDNYFIMHVSMTATTPVQAAVCGL